MRQSSSKRPSCREGSSSSACRDPRQETITWPARRATSRTLSALSDSPERTTGRGAQEGGRARVMVRVRVRDRCRTKRDGGMRLGGWERG